MNRAVLICLLLSATAAQADPRLDRYGDPLPDGAVERLGSDRFRHPDTINQLVVSPDGKRIATTCYHRPEVYVWDRTSGRLERTLQPRDWKGDSTTYDRLAFSPDGKLLVRGGASDGSTSVWSVTSGALLHVLAGDPKNAVMAVAFDGRGHLVTVSFHHVTWWDATSGRRLRMNRAKEILSSTISLASGLVVTEQTRGRIEIADLSTGVVKHTLKGSFAKSASTSCMAFAPKGDRLAALGEDRVVRLWDLKEERLAASWRQTALSRTPDLMFSADGKRLLIEDGGGIISLDAAWGAVRRYSVGSLIHRFALVPNSEDIALSMGRTLRILDRTSAKVIGPVGHSWVPLGVAMTLTPTSRLAATATGDEIRFWSLPDCKPKRVIAGPAAELAFSTDGRLLASTRKGTVSLWDAPSGRRVHFLPKADAPAFSSDGKLLAVRTDKRIRILDTVSWKTTRTLPGEWWCASFSSDGRTIAVGGEQGGGSFDIASGKRLRSLPLKSVSELDFSPDGRFLVGWSRGSVRLVSSETARIVSTRAVAKRMGRPWFAPDGKRILVVTQDGLKIQLLDLTSGRVERTFQRAHRWGEVNCAAFSPKGDALLTGMDSGASLLWALGSANPPAPKRVPALVEIHEPPSLADHLYEGGTRLQRCQLTQAREALDRALAVDSWSFEALGLRAEILLRLGDLKGATRDLARSCGYYGGTRSTDRRGQRVQADLLLAQGRVGEAIDAYGEAMWLYSSYEGYAGRARALFQAGRLDEARADCDRAIAIDPSTPLALALRGRILIRQGDRSRAADDFERALKFKPLDWRVWRDCAAGFQKLEKPEAAQAALKKALELAPPSFRKQLSRSGRRSD